MKTKQEKKGGVALILLAIIATLPFLIGSYATYSINNQRITQKAMHYIRARILAENMLRAGGESFYLALKRRPTIRPETLKSQLNKSSFRTKIKNISITSTDLQEGFSAPIFSFTPTRSGLSNLVSIVVGVRNRDSDVKVALKTDYSVKEEPFLNYAIFTDGIFEISSSPSMEIRGGVRSNGKIRIGGTSPRPNTYLSFYDKLWGAEDIEVFPGWAGGRGVNVAAQHIRAKDPYGNWANFFDPTPGIPLDSGHPNWDADSQTHWAKDLIKDHVPAIKPPIESSDTHLLIEPESTSDDPTLQREKFAWKAKKQGGLYIKVNKAGVVTYSFNGGAFQGTKNKDIALPGLKNPTNGVYAIQNPRKPWKSGKGWIEVDEHFEDLRETGNKHIPVRVVNLYMDNLLKKFPGANLIYVEIEDNKGSNDPHLKVPSHNLATLRIRNGNDISAARNGLTVSTHRMAYVEGNFNVKNKVSSLIACDNVTLLSNAWDDSVSKSYGTSRPPIALMDRNYWPKEATETWLQAALLIGGIPYKEERPLSSINGIHNLVRFRENWASVPYHFLGSYVKLFNGQESSCISKSGGSRGYFLAPNRYVEYDEDLLNNTPPGMPTSLTDPDTLLWSEISWALAEQLKNP